MGIAAVVIVATAVGGAADSDVRVWVYRVAAGLLAALAALTALTGARTPVVWFKICPFVLTGSAALLVAASLLQTRVLAAVPPCQLSHNVPNALAPEPPCSARPLTQS